MEIGLSIPHTGAQATPEFVRRWCTTADDAGFGVLWGVDHVVMPRDVASKYDLPRKPAAMAENTVSERLSPNLEVITALSYVAAITSHIRIGTAVEVLPIRNAMLNARQLATIDRYSAGRLLCGVGIGWLKGEADTMGMPWDRRGARADEHIALLRTIWSPAGRHVEFHGEFWNIPPIDPEPRPVQQPVPIIVGGHSTAAIERAARLGDGWIASGMSPRRLAKTLPLVRASTARHGRDPASLRIYCRSKGATSLDEVRTYAELGVHSLHVPIRTLDGLQRFAEHVLPALT